MASMSREPIGPDDLLTTGIINPTMASWLGKEERDTMWSTTGFQLCRNGFARALCACLIAITAGRVWGQEDPGQLKFEVASVKLHIATSPSTGRSGVEETPGLVRIEDLPLKVVIGIAYGVKDFQIEGPRWLGDVRVDIDAKPPAGYKHAQLQPLLRNLLADRFKLAVHHESKEVPAFALVVAKGGSKLHEATKPRDFLTGRPGLIECARVSISQLATVLARVLGSPVVDETGLTAMYQVKLEWTPDQTSPATSADEQKGAPEPGPSLFATLNDQLGLRLQTRKVPVDVLIIDHMERVPTEN
jgi:uncharacterized protein (TIGR03435 family)